VLHQIGAGSLGPVYRAYQPELDRLVAVKMFRLEVSADQAQQFVAELEKLIAADLTHPGIAAPLGTGIASASPYLAQDFIAADSLDAAIRDNGPAPLPDAVRVAAQLADALDFAAAVDVVHGALHPRDVLISPDDTRLTGLGIARALDRISVPSPLHSPYTAPERAEGRHWDRRADVFSLAAVVFELMWGRQPVGFGIAAAEGISPVSGGDTSQLQNVFGRALAANPEDRFDTAVGFAAALKTCFVDPPVETGGMFAAQPEAPHGRVFPEFDLADLGDRDPDGLIAREFPFLEAEGPDQGDDGLRLSLDALDAPEPAFSADRVRAEDLDEPDREREDELPFGAFETPQVDDLGPPPPEVPPVPRVDDKPVEHHVERTPPAAPAPPPSSSGFAFSEYAAESSRSAVWPLVLALLVGVAVGAAATFLLMNRDRPIIQVGVQPGAEDPSRQTTQSANQPDGRTTSPAAGRAENQAGSAASGSAPPVVRGAAPPPREFTDGAVSARPAAPPRPQADAPRERVSPPTEPGRLLVRSTPAGARVLIDGKNAGLTPVILRDLEPGPHTVRVLRDGYLAAERRVSITAARPAPSLIVALTRVRDGQRAAVPVPSTPASIGRTAGVLFVESRPIGANVFVDDKMVGTTPMQMDGVDSGAHVVRLERPGYRDWSSAIRVVPGERLRVSASLER
jgi:serine/threonine protein kinase